MKFILFIFIQVLLFSVNCLAYLHASQTSLINKLIQNNNLTPIMRNQIDAILYYNYKNKTSSDAYIFYKKNYKLLKNVKMNVLNLYAQTGLIKSIKKFNGQSNFYNYSKIYINSEMLKCISEHQFNILPHSLKTSHKIPKYIKSKYNIINFGSTNTEDEWKLDDITSIIYNQDYNNVNNKLLNVQIVLNKLDPKIKRTFNYRYDSNLKIIRSLRDVSELMCWSDEKTRLVLIEAFDKIKLELKTNPDLF